MRNNPSILQRSFYERDAASVARDLLGKSLVRQIGAHQLAGAINEVEAYYGAHDSASHASRGRTQRNSVMFGQAGMAYVYFVYGMHNMFNIVTEKEGVAGAVLIRSLIPQDGVDRMIANRNGARRDVANGPARLCKALEIDRGLNKWDLTVGERLWLENGTTVAEQHIQALPRIGIDYAEQKDRNALLRFCLPAEKFKMQISK